MLRLWRQNRSRLGYCSYPSSSNTYYNVWLYTIIDSALRHKEMRQTLAHLGSIPCPSIGTHTLQRNDETRTVVVDNQVVQFTPTEYRVLLPLLQGQPLSDTELAQAAFSRGIDTLIRESLDKHIDKIRGKLELVGLSVYRLRRFGYILSSSSD